MTAPHPAEYVKARLDAGDIEGAEIAVYMQFSEGFRAQAAGKPFEDFRPVAWQDGWRVAQQYDEFASAIATRLDLYP